MNDLEWHLLEDSDPLDHISLSGVEVHAGDKVRLRPKPGADIMDSFLAGRIAIVEKIEQDYEGTIQLAVVLEEDPGRDLGMLRQPGHRFFFRVDEVEPL